MALLAELARELGEPDIAKGDPAERANAVRRALAGKRALIVIDNLETLAEAERLRVFQFLGRLPEGNKAIVTSRRRSDVDARAIRLDRLAQADAFAAAGRDREAQPAPGARQRGRAAGALRADARQPAADPVDGRAVGPGAVPHRGRGVRLPADRAARQRSAGIHLRRPGGELQRERDEGAGRAGALHPACAGQMGGRHRRAGRAGRADRAGRPGRPRLAGRQPRRGELPAAAAGRALPEDAAGPRPWPRPPAG